jgi:fibronectin-binding autotransporter adhesin
MINWNANIIEAIRSQPRGDKWNEYPAQVIVIGGGGGGEAADSTNQAGGGGGGAGHLISASYDINPLSTYTITVGAGGVGGSTNRLVYANSGSATIFSSASVQIFYALGGGEGGFRGEYDGIPAGGSGGGAVGGPSQFVYSKGGLSLPVPSGSNYITTITGSKGADGYVYAAGGQTLFQIGGGGGGSAAAGTQATSQFGGAGGAGTTIPFISAVVAKGGDGGGAPAATPGAPGVSTGANATLFGSGGGGANGFAGGGNGASGSVIIAYYGEQKGTGGTVSTFGDYTVHHFTGSGTFVSTGYRG